MIERLGQDTASFHVRVLERTGEGEARATGMDLKENFRKNKDKGLGPFDTGKVM